MNVRCPNCGAVFPVAAGAAGDAECPLCLHQFAAGEGHTQSLSVDDAAAIGAQTVAKQTLPDGRFANAGDTSAIGGADPFAGASGGSAGADSEVIDFGALLGDDGGVPAAAAPSASASTDPFGSSGADADLFGGAADDPFAAPAAPAPSGASDPFASASGADSPFAGPSGAADPFAASAGAADPFAGPAGAADPFASAGAADPFAAPAGVADPFAASGGDPFGGGANPFGGADPFGGSNPFGTGQQDTVVLPGGSGPAPAADTSLFGDDDEDSLFLATPSTSGAMFDEQDDEHEDDHVDSFATPQAVAGDDPAAALSSGDAPKRGIAASLGPLVLVAVALVGLDFAGVLDLGIAKLLKGSADQTEKASKQPTVAANLISPIELRDSLKTYLGEIDRLQEVVRLSPSDRLVHQQLTDRLLDVYERFPGIFDTQPHYRKTLEGMQNKTGIPARYEMLKLLAASQRDGLDDKLRGFVERADVVADDYGVAALGMMDVFRAARREHILANPGEFSDPGVDPLALPQPDDKRLVRAREWLDKALAMSDKAPNRLKFHYHDARLRWMMGDHEKNAENLEKIVAKYPEHNRFTLLLASAYVSTNKLGSAATLLRKAHAAAVGSGRKGDLVIMYRIEAALEARRGRPDDQIKALEGVVALRKRDELTITRLARLQLQQKHAQEAQELLVRGKKAGFKSIAFEVALVDYWLWASRTEDALEEIKVATKLYPDTVELLFLRGQIEDRQQHFATARDYFAKVIERRPKHMRALLRLAELQSQAGRHDDALMTLSNARERLGDLDSILERMADELVTLKRPTDARVLYDELLRRQPSNKKYLVNAAHIDMMNGEVDRALKYMRMLRDDGNLDQAGALQMAAALVIKGNHTEAAKTIVPFAEKDPNNVRINVLAGKALLDSDQLDLARTFLLRAYQVAQRSGGDAEALFHYGRLAFKLGDAKQGMARLQQAIKADPKQPWYRYFVAKTLFEIEAKGTAKEPVAPVAVREMEYLIMHAERFANAGTPLVWLDDVHRQLGLHKLREKRYDEAIPHLRKSVELNSKDAPTQVRLGAALYHVNDPTAERVLRRVVATSPNEPIAALYIGLLSQQKSNSTEALKWLRKAAQSNRPEVAEAWFQIALLHRERRAFSQARKAMRTFLQRARKDDPLREEGEAILEDLKS